ncbi:MAG: pentapeptide repeat-containing protein [Clostridiales bacterium]|jgi:hypothetical protein|nr:pentapeptide repeat-containing protein [Clostridiales bacterium]
MSKQVGQKMFGDTGVARKSLELRSVLDRYIRVNFDELINKFVECFEQYAQKIVSMQQTGKKAPIAFINFSVLRTNILAKHHILRIDAYDKNWYADRTECSGEYEASEVYQWLDTFESILEESRKKSGGTLTLLDVQTQVFEESYNYLLYVVEIIRAGMRKVAEIESYQKINRYEVFTVCVGSFQDVSQIVYKEDTTIKDAKAVKRSLQAAQQSQYAYEICNGLNLSEGNYEGGKILFSSFIGSDFTGSSFKKSVMLGNNFQEAILRNTNMEQIRAIDTNFSGALLENVNFRGAELNHISFVGSKLINVSFEDVLIATDIDFEKAELVDTMVPQMQGNR